MSETTDTGASSKVFEMAEVAGQQAEGASEEGESPLQWVKDAYEQAVAPVAGPRWWRWLYLGMFLGGVGFFIYTIYSAASTWSEPITTVTPEFRESLPYPDVYVCFPASVIGGIAARNSVMDFNLWPKKNSQDQDDGYFCNQGLTQKTSPDQFQDATPLPAGMSNCPTTNTTDGTFVNELLQQLPKANIAGTEYSSKCWYFAMQDGASISHNVQALLMGSFVFTPVVDDVAVYAELYFMEAGKSPVLRDSHGKSYIGASKAFAGMQLLYSSMYMTLEEVQDKIKGDKTFKPRYSVSSNVALSEPSVVNGFSNGQVVLDSYSTGGFLLSFQTFVVNQVVIRRITVGEIWAQLGGLWAGIAAFMSLFFTLSGKIGANDREAYIFRYLRGKTRNSYLSSLKDKEDDPEVFLSRLAAVEQACGIAPAAEPAASKAGEEAL
jgi:hypothetical protein